MVTESASATASPAKTSAFWAKVGLAAILGLTLWSPSQALETLKFVLWGMILSNICLNLASFVAVYSSYTRPNCRLK